MIAPQHQLFPVSAKALFPLSTFYNCQDIQIKSCHYKSDRICAGDVYVAMEDPSVDSSGIEQALKRGAVGVIVRNEFALSDGPCDCLAGCPYCQIQNPHQAYGVITQALHGFPGKTMRVVGVTGTQGRRTTAYLISEILSRTGHKTGLLTERGVTIFGNPQFDHAPKSVEEFKQYMEETVKSFPAVMPGLPPKKNAYWLAKMNQHNCTDAVIEVSQMALDKASVAGISFHAVCVTQDKTQSKNEQKKLTSVRCKLIDQVEPKGFAVVNTDNPASNTILTGHVGPILTFGINGSPQVQGSILEQRLGEQMSLITAGSQTMPLRTRIVGKDYLYSCLCAIAYGLTCNISLSSLIHIIESVEIIPGYMQIVNTGRDFTVILVQDLSNSDDSLINNLKTIQEISDGRILCVLPIPQQNWESEKNDFDPRIFRSSKDKVFLIGKQSDNPEFFNALVQRLPNGVITLPDKEDALLTALNNVQAGDCVVVAGEDNCHNCLKVDYVSDDERILMFLR